MIWWLSSNCLYWSNVLLTIVLLFMILLLHFHWLGGMDIYFVGMNGINIFRFILNSLGAWVRIVCIDGMYCYRFFCCVWFFCYNCLYWWIVLLSIVLLCMILLFYFHWLEGMDIFHWNEWKWYISFHLELIRRLSLLFLHFHRLIIYFVSFWIR